MIGESVGNIFLNVVMRINDDYCQLLSHLAEMDTRAAYLMRFELTLSTALSTDLWTTEAYVKQQSKMPLPMDPYTILPYDTFRAWLTVYETVMRDDGLIGTKPKMLMGWDA